jgi:hypothetical protein
VEIGQGLRICNQVLKPTVGLLEAQLYFLSFCFVTQKAVFIVICFSLYRYDIHWAETLASVNIKSIQAVKRVAGDTGELRENF